MADRVTNGRTPPVNGELVAITRGGVAIWEGSKPAYVESRQDWVPTSSGVYQSQQTLELAIPVIEVPADSPELPQPGDYPDPEPPPDYEPPDYDDIEPPPPPAEGTDDYPYVPPEDVPDPVSTLPGTWHDVLARTIGYGRNGVAAGALNWIGGDATALSFEDRWGGAMRACLGGNVPSDFSGNPPTAPGHPENVPYFPRGEGGPHLPKPPRVIPDNRMENFGGGGLFQTDESCGGLHWTLQPGADGLVDQTGDGWTGATAGGIALGNMNSYPRRLGPDGVPGSGRATYFNGVDSRVVSTFNPFATGIMPATTPEEIAEKNAHRASYGDTFEYGLVLGNARRGSRMHTFEDYPTHAGTRESTFYLYKEGARSTGGANGPGFKFEDSEADQNWPTGAGTRGYAYNVESPNNVRLPYDIPYVAVSAWVRRQNTDHEHTLFCSSGDDPYRFYLPGSDSEEGGMGGYWVDDPTYPDGSGHFWGMYPSGGDGSLGIRRPVFEMPASAGDPGNPYDTLDDVGDGPIKVQWKLAAWPVNQDQWVHYVLEIWPPYTWSSSRDQGFLTLWINGQLAQYQYVSGTAALANRSARIQTPNLGAKRLGPPSFEVVPADYGGIVAGHHEHSWQGAMTDFCVLVSRLGTRAEPGDVDSYFERDWGRESRGSYARNGANFDYEYLYNTNPIAAAPTTFAARAATPDGPTALTAVDVTSPIPPSVSAAPAPLVKVIPRNGDRVHYRHAGQIYATTIKGVEEREDFGFYRLFG